MSRRIVNCIARVLPGACLLIAAGCGPSVYYVKPPDWKEPSVRDTVIAHYGRFYQDRIIFLDPGHGGEDRRNEGPKGEKEADINLRVSLYLREFLTRAGTNVIMSRTADSTVPLRERSRMASASGADFFVSIHHNAAGNEFTNYTSTYYHATEADPEYHPSNHNIARYIQRDLSYVLGNSGPLISFDGTASDYTVYPLSGFSVLRHATIPAVLIEGAFFSSKYEEKRLKKEEFNEIEAWGIFRGLGRYLEAGFPRLELLPAPEDTSYRPILSVWASDTSSIDWNSTVVEIDGEEMAHFSNEYTGVITCMPDHDLASGDHTFEVRVRNTKGNWSLPFAHRFTVRPAPYAIELEINPGRIPPHENALARVKVEVRDRKGQAVADSTVVRLSASRGSVPDSIFTVTGSAEAYIRAVREEGMAVVIVRAGDVVDADTIRFVLDGSSYLSGTIYSAPDGTELENASVVIQCVDTLGGQVDSLTTRREGKFIWQTEDCDSVRITAEAEGYYGEQDSTALNQPAHYQTVSLEPIARGILFGQTFLIDPRYGGIETGDTATDGLRASDVNLGIARYLHRLLEASGADVHLLRSQDETIPERTRVYSSKQFQDGFYIRIDASSRTGAAGCIIYQSLKNERLGQTILKGISETVQVDTIGVRGSNDRFYYDVAVGTITVFLPSVDHPLYRSNNLEHVESSLAWGIYRGILMNAGYETKTLPSYLRKIIDANTGLPAGGKEVLLDLALVAVSDDDGIVRFFDVEGSRGVVQVVGEGRYEILE